MDKALQTMIDNLPEKTGKSLEEWLKVLAEQKFSKHMEAVKFLKQEHGVTHGFANTIVHLSKDDKSSSEDLVAIQYKGKESLQPIYELLRKAIGEFGDDIEFVPKKASVSVRRKKQFALIQPSTKTRVDLGLALKGKAATERLETWNAMCSHRIRLTATDEVDGEVLTFLREAYEGAG